MTELYYDSHCGPCSLFARSARGLSRRRLTILPLDGPGADRALSDLVLERRFEYAHVVFHDERRSGPDILAPLMEEVFGSPGRRFAEQFPPTRWLLRTLYQSFWRHRNNGGCVAVTSARAG